MLDPQLLRDQPQKLEKMLADRSDKTDLKRLLDLDHKRRELQQEVEALRNERNQRSKELGEKKRQGEDITKESQDVRLLGDKLETLEKKQEELLLEFNHQILFLPNIPREDVPIGKDAAHNRVIRTWGKKPNLDFKPLDHVAIGEKWQGLDFSRAVRMSTARFALYRGWAARLERALINFMLDLHTKEHGYEEVLPPFLVNREAITATGNLPKFEQDLFHIGKEDLFLIPTAEVPVTNIHREEILDESLLPVNFVAYTPCFRSEAGSYGKDTHGLIRQHQFNKVELVRLTTPEKSLEELEMLTLHAEKVLQRLNLHYRVVQLCSGDLGFASSKTYDLEVWLPGENTYREISSCSNFSDFQARRAKIRYRPKAGGKPALVHTLNGSGLAIGRTLIAVLENHQQADGKIRIPEALVPYFGAAIIPT